MPHQTLQVGVGLKTTHLPRILGGERVIKNRKKRRENKKDLKTKK